MMLAGNACKTAALYEKAVFEQNPPHPIPHCLLNIFNSRLCATVCKYFTNIQFHVLGVKDNVFLLLSCLMTITWVNLPINKIDVGITCLQVWF